MDEKTKKHEEESTHWVPPVLTGEYVETLMNGECLKAPEALKGKLILA